jgi:hypothetical protein
MADRGRSQLSIYFSMASICDAAAIMFLPEPPNPHDHATLALPQSSCGLRSYSPIAVLPVQPKKTRYISEVVPLEFPGKLVELEILSNAFGIRLDFIVSDRFIYFVA